MADVPVADSTKIEKMDTADDVEFSKSAAKEELKAIVEKQAVLETPLKYRTEDSAPRLLRLKNRYLLSQMLEKQKLEEKEVSSSADSTVKSEPASPEMETLPVSKLKEACQPSFEPISPPPLGPERLPDVSSL